MDPRIQEILSTAREESPALPFPDLVRRLRCRGAAVNERVLRRTLARADSGVRLLDPWLAPLGPLRAYLEDRDRTRPVRAAPAAADGASGAPKGTRGRHRDREGRRPRPEAVRLWVLTAPDDDDPPDPGAPAACRVRETLRYLGRHLDARSPGDVARWVSLVREAETLPQAA